MGCEGGLLIEHRITPKSDVQWKLAQGLMVPVNLHPITSWSEIDKTITPLRKLLIWFNILVCGLQKLTGICLCVITFFKNWFWMRWTDFCCLYWVGLAKHGDFSEEVKFNDRNDCHEAPRNYQTQIWTFVAMDVYCKWM